MAYMATSTAIDQQPSDVIFQARDVSVTFGSGEDRSKVLHDVNFDVRRGETLGIVGESGSGKSMFATSLMHAVEEPGRVSGDVTYYPGDRDEPFRVLEMNDEELKEEIRWTRIASVVQSAQSAFNPTMTIEDHFLETFNTHDVNEAEGLERAHKVCEDLYLNPEQVFPSYPHELSGGMKQRAMIALAVVLDPEVLILDEPTAALDLLMQRAIVTLLQEIKEKYELTMLFVTHDLNLVSLIADRIGVMYAFEFAEVGPVTEIMSNPSHPYTRGLLNSAPNVSAPIESMSGIPGTAPNPKRIPEGCSYQQRCPIAEERCEREDPMLRNVEETELPYEERSPTGHTAACFYPERSRREVECYLEAEQ